MRASSTWAAAATASARPPSTTSTSHWPATRSRTPDGRRCWQGSASRPGDYAPVAGSSRPLRRRNQILALMARNGYIPEQLARRCQAEPIGVVRRAVAKTDAPAVIEHVLDELQAHGGERFAVEDLFQGRIRVRSTVDQRVQKIVNEALENGLASYEKRHPARPGADPGFGGGAGQRGRGDPGRGGGAAALQPSAEPLLRLQPRDRLSASARLGDEAARLPGRLSQRSDARRHGARRAHQRAGRLRGRGQVDRQLRRQVQGSDPRPPGAGRVAQRGGGVDCRRPSAWRR